MALNFPLSPTVGDKWPTPAVANLPQYTWDGQKWTVSGPSTVATFVAKGGDTMSGALVLPADPTSALQAATKNYAEVSIRQINQQTVTAYIPVLSDTGKLLWLYNAAATTLTVPPNSAAAFPIGAQIDIVQAAAGQVTVVQGPGVTIVSMDNAKKLMKVYATATLVKVATDTWLLTGALTI